MEIIIDYDMTILDNSSFGDDGININSTGYNFSDFLNRTIITKGLVYALRNLESAGIDYSFYTRIKDFGDGSFLSRSSNIRVFRFMPLKTEHFKGFVDHVSDDCSLFVTSEKELLYSIIDKCPVVYLGEYDQDMHKRPNLYQIDGFTQLPMLANDVRLGTAV